MTAIPQERDMSNKKEKTKPSDCPDCGEPIPENAPQDLCPKCLMVAAAKPAESATVAMSHLHFTPPSVEEIAEAFPQLEVLELIGRGGMGAVYKARQPNLDRIVALKILPQSLAESPEFSKRFTREGRVLAKLNHPSIVGVFDFGESGGYFYLLMEFVDGVNLRQAMRAGRFTPGQALEVVPKICEALQFAHDEGVLHRDIKPENILLDTKGRIKIADFGIAKLLGTAAENEPTLTQTAMPGTPQYMAPEQIEKPGDVDHRADIYSLGVVFYEMLTGELPIGRFAAPSEKTGVTSEIDEIVFRSLEKEPGSRQQSANEVRTEIAGVSPLTDVPPPGLGGASTATASQSDDPKNRPALALALTFFGIIFPIIMFFAAVVMANQGHIHRVARDQSQSIVTLRTSQIIYDLKNEIASVERQGATLEDIQNLKLHLATAQKQDKRLKGRRRNSVQREEIKFLPLLIAAFFLLVLCGVPGTVFGWMQLRRQRILGLNSGRPALITAAWFWPMLVVFAAVFLLILVPCLQGPGWMGGVGISLSFITSIVVSVLLIRRTTKWINAPVSATERSQFADLEQIRSLKLPLKQRRLLCVFTLVSAISLTLLVVFGLVSQSIYSARSGGSDGSLIPGILIAGTIWVIFSIAYYLLINRTYLPKKALPHPNYNPWPKRVFWLVLAVFIGPPIILGTPFVMGLAKGLSNPMLNIQGDQAVAVRSITSDEKRHVVQFEFINKTSEVVRAELTFEGTPLTEPSPYPDGLSPGETKIIEIMPGRNKIGVAFNLPDDYTTKVVASELQLLLKQRIGSGRVLFYEDLEVLPLFRVEAKPRNYSAMIHFLPHAKSPVQ